MSAGARLVLAAAAAGVLFLATAATALAFWAATGGGAGSGGATTLGRPTVTTATPGAGTVSLAWSAVAAPGPGTMKYAVLRDGAAAGGTCPTAAAPAAVLSCTDSGLSRGTYGYVVSAVWSSWTATSSPARSVTLASGALARLSLAAASTTPAAGTADSLTVAAQDAQGYTVTTYAGSHSLTFSGASSIGGYNPAVTNSTGTAVAFGNPAALSFVAGVASVSESSNGVMYLYKAETASVTVSEGGAYTSLALSVTVSGGNIASLEMPTPSSQVAGTPFTVSITATDAYGNRAGVTGTRCMTFSGPASSPYGTAPTYPAQGGCAAGQGAVSFTAGVATGVSVTLYNASAATTLTVTDVPSAKSVSTAAFAVAVASMSKLSLAAATTTPAIAAADSLTITATDAYGNRTTSYAGTHTLTFAGASASGGFSPTVTNATGTAVSFGSGTAITFTAGVATVSGGSNGVMRLYRVETASITVSEGGSYTSAALAVTPSLPTGFGLKVQYHNFDAAAPYDNVVKPDVQIVNTGSVSVDLAQVDVRYWFTRDGGANTYQVTCDYAVTSWGNLTLTMANLSPVRSGADAYLEAGYTAGAATLAAGTSTGETQLRFSKTDWSTFNETNDYSYGTATSFVDAPKITAYFYGNLVWGTEP